MIIASKYEDRRLKMIAKLARGKTVLDVGYAQLPNPHLSGFLRTGIDLNPPAPSATRYDEELVGDVGELQQRFPGRTFDTIICAELIEHLENPYALLRALRPLLSKDGRLIVSTPNPLAVPVVIAEVLRLRRFFYTRDHLYYFLPRWVERLFDATGFNVDGIHGVGLWTGTALIPPAPVALSYQVIYVGSPK